MKKIYLSLLLGIFFLMGNAQNAPFITTWEVYGYNSLHIYAQGTGYNYNIDFGDGTVLYNQTGTSSHNYSTSGTYSVSITGDFPKIKLGTNSSAKLLSVEQWGDIQWGSMEKAFQNCRTVVINATDTPDLSNVTNMDFMFSGTLIGSTGNLNNWDVSHITSMKSTFSYTPFFNQPLNSWNVSNVTNMEGLFRDASVFNHSIANWDVSNVTNMSKMFMNATDYNQPMLNWNVGNVTDMSEMFYMAIEFNQNIEAWDITNVSSLYKMFTHAVSFNQNLSSWNFNVNSLYYFLDYTNLSTSNYDSLLSSLLSSGSINVALGAIGLTYCDEFTRDNLIDAGWSLSGDSHLINCNPTYSSDAFVFDYKAELSALLEIHTDGSGYNYSIDYGDGTIQTNLSGDVSHQYTTTGTYRIIITGDFPYFTLSNPLRLTNIIQWGTNQWSSFNSIFANCTNLRISAQDTPNLTAVTDMSYMFQNASNFNSLINNWDVSNVTNMSYMFDHCTNYNKDLNNWNTSNVTDMSYMFHSAENFNKSLDTWDVSNVINMSHMFFDADNFSRNINAWNTSSVQNMSYMFASENSISAPNHFNQPIHDWNTGNVTDMSGLFFNNSYFNQPLDNWDVSNVTTMNRMFYDSESFNKPLNNWNTSSVTDMSYMFYLTNYFNQPLDNWDVSNVTNMTYMFATSKKFNQNIDNWDTSNVTDMSYMFWDCAFNAPLNNWNVSNVTNMQAMFSYASVFNQPLDNWDVSNVTNMSYMFGVTENFNQPLNNWNVHNVTNMQAMFTYASVFNQPLGSWDISNVTDIRQMFRYASMFNQDLSSWQFNSTHNLVSFISYSNMSIINYDLLLEALVLDGTTDGHLGASDLYYCNDAAHSYLENTLNWGINGDSLDAYCSSYANEQFENLETASIYPNPATNSVQVKISNNSTLQNVTLYTLQGQKVLQTNTQSIDIANLTSGIYLVEITTNEGTLTQKLVKN